MIERRVVRQGSEPEQYRYGTVHRVVALRGLGNSAELSEAITPMYSHLSDRPWPQASIPVMPLQSGFPDFEQYLKDTHEQASRIS